VIARFGQKRRYQEFLRGVIMKNVCSILLLLGLLSLTATAQEKEKTWGEATIMVLTSSSVFGEYSNTQHMITSYLSTNLKAPEGASGTLTVPDDLGIGPVIPLTIQNIETVKQPDRLYYWSCTETVPEGQPETRGWQWKKKDWWWTVRSTAVADAMKMMGLNAQSPVPGPYSMDTTYTGSMSVTLTKAQQFLPPLKVTSPPSGDIDTSKPISVTWEGVEGAGGYYVAAYGKNADGKDVTWESSYDATLWQRMGLTKSLEKGLLHGPEHRKCTIPGGIFKGQVVINVSGVSHIATGTGAFSYWGWAESKTSVILNTGS
jgi:hypothetical protein